MSIEMLILTPALMACVIAVVIGARFVEARSHTQDAAYAAARAASLTTDPGAAQDAGHEAAAQAFDADGQSCSHLTVRIDTRDLQPGGNIRAMVTCLVDLSDLSGFGLPGTKTYSSTAVVPIDTHRVL